MFGTNSFAVKTVLLWSVLCVVLVESVRQKKDVHHMIILNDKLRSTRSHRHKHHSYGKDRYKRRPSGKTKHSYSSYSSEEGGKTKHRYPSYSSEEGGSFEEFSEEKSLRHKAARPSRNHHSHHHKHNRHRDHYRQEDNHIQSQPYSTIPEINWQPLSSQEFFGNAQPSNLEPLQVFPGAFQKGSIQYSQPIPIEITTPYSMPSNAFISYESTLYPPLYQTPKPTDSYKPFDYSVLNKKPASPGGGEGSKSIIASPSTHYDSKAVTPFSIIIGNSTEIKEKDKQEDGKEEGAVRGSRKKPRRGRGGNKFQWGQKEGA